MWLLGIEFRVFRRAVMLLTTGPSLQTQQSLLLMILDNWTKDVLCWEGSSRFVLTGKKRLWIPSKVMRIRADTERPP